TVAPTLSSTSPVVGTTLNVSSEGAWTNKPLVYTYQWYDCVSESAEWKACTVVQGAVNKTYTPQAKDAGYHLLARVAAQNSTGLTYAGTAASKTIPLTQPSFVSPAFGSKGAGVGQMEKPQSIATDANGNVWIADYTNNRIDEFSSGGTFVRAAGWGVKDGKAEAEICTTSCQAGTAGSGNGQLNLPWGIAVNKETGNVYV